MSLMSTLLRINRRHRLLAVAAALIVVLTAACRSNPAPSHGAAAGDSQAPAASAADPVAATPTAAAPAAVSVDTQRVALAVSGMYCESCESTVGAMLRRTPGVVHIEVSAKRGEAVITFDPTRTSPAQLAEAVERLGYSATVKGQGERREG